MSQHTQPPDGPASPTLDEVIANTRAEATTLRRHGHHAQAERLEELAALVAEHTEEWRRFLSESDARLYTGRGRDYFRSHRADWERRGHAEKRGGAWYYRQCVLPHRADVAAAYNEGLLGETAHAAAPAGGRDVAA